MAHGARLDSVVMFVHDLNRSVSFYSDVLNLHVADRSATAALLIGAKRSQLILRAMGRGAEHVTAVEGRDPDDIVVMITYPGPDQAPLHELPVRIYGW